MPRDSRPRNIVVRTSDEQHEMDILENRGVYQHLKSGFWPITIIITIICGLIFGILGAVMGFFSGLIVGGLFVLSAKRRKAESENRYRNMLDIRDEFRRQ